MTQPIKKLVVGEGSRRKESTVSATGEFVLSTVRSICQLKSADVACVPRIICL